MSLNYPCTRIGDAVETLADVSFPDPYRWLEGEGEEVRQWQRSQAALAGAHVREWPHFDRLRRLVEQFNSDRYVPLPQHAAGRWFRLRTPPSAAQAQAVVADEPMGEGRVLFDPAVDSPGRPPFLSWLAPSPDGRTLAVGVCADGSESNTIRLIDVASGRALEYSPPQMLMDNWTGGVTWLPDSSGFFYSALSGPATDFTQYVYLHRLGAPPPAAPLDIPWVTPKDYRVALLSRDGRHVVAVERIRNPIPVAIARLGGSALQWRPFVTSVAGTLAGHVVNGRYIAVTDVGAPRGRLVAVPLDVADPNDPRGWRELIAESDAVLRAVTPVGKLLYLTEFVDTYARVRIVDLESRVVGEVPLPDRGAVLRLFPQQNLLPLVTGHREKFIFGFSSLTVAPAIYSHTPGDGRIELLQPPQAQLENTVVEDRWAVSKDGTRVPYHLLRRADLDPRQPHPTLIFGYGGFNAPLVPQFPGPMAAFVAAGGILIHAHLRGGGELGLQWWQGGRKENKQNGYDDLYTIAEELIAARVCTRRSLAVVGGSNGGLMAAVAAMQRPDLWAVAVPRVPILDLIGACRDPYARSAIQLEMADIGKPDEVRRLASFSPYHLVREGVAYPAIFIDAGDTDPRCPPWHSRKFVARLQAATGGIAPILLHVWENVGHGWATDKATLVIEHTEWIAFTFRHLGLHWPATPP